MKRNELSIEHLVYLVILVIAIFLRFQSLGLNPLDDRESVFALQSLGISRGENSVTTGEPGYVVLTAALFTLFRADEFHARLIPALLGSILVLVPFLYQGLIGKKTALLAAIFLAIDPILIAQSRAAGGVMFALAGITAGIGFLLNRKIIPAGILIGLAVLGGAGFWFGLIALALFGVAFRKQIRILVGSAVDWNKQNFLKLVFSFVATIVFIGSMFMLIPQGMSWIGGGLISYITSWSGNAGSRLADVTITWGLTYLPIFLVAVWGVFTSSRTFKGIRLRILAVMVLLWLIAVLNPQLMMENLTWVSVLLWLLAAFMLCEYSEKLEIQQKFVWLSMTVLFIVMCGFSFGNLNNLFYDVSPSPEIIQGRLLGVFLPFVLLLLVSILVSWSWSRKDTFSGILTGLLLVLVMTIPGSTWRATGLTNQWTNEVWHAHGLPVGASTLRNELQTFGKWASGQATGLDILVKGIDDPSLLWAVREYNQVLESPVTDPDYQPKVIITRSEDMIETASIYRGQNFTWQSGPDLPRMTLRDWVHWRLFRQAPSFKTSYVLWVRNDIFPGGTTQ